MISVKDGQIVEQVNKCRLVINVFCPIFTNLIKIIRELMMNLLKKQWKMGEMVIIMIKVFKE